MASPSVIECFEVFKLRELMSRLDGDDEKTVLMAIRRIEDLEREVARDDELWRGVTVAAAEHRPGCICWSCMR